MKITGIIAEYNPFHNGHQYQIQAAKQNGSAVVAVMSGSFVQRGEVAVFDKWTRAKAALMHGVDLVIELPVCYALNAAERFAFGGVSLLENLGVVDTLCFGSESGDLCSLQNAASLLLHETPDISRKIETYMQTGLGFPAARQKAYANLIPEEILCSPNNILALEYLCALEKCQSKIQPMTLKRESVGYHDTRTVGNFASAKAVREHIQSGDAYQDFVPSKAYTLYENAVQYQTSRLDSILSYRLRTITPDCLKSIQDVTEGLENRLIEAARGADTFESIVEYAKTKRYTTARIRRICIAALLGLTPDIAKAPPKYARVLGMNETGKAVLAAARKKASLEIVTKTADYTGQDMMFEKDILSTDIAALCADNPAARMAGKDFKTSPVMI